MKEHLTLIRILVVGSIAMLAAAAVVTPLPGEPSNWGNTLTVIGSLGYLVSLVLLLVGSERDGYSYPALQSLYLACHLPHTQQAISTRYMT